VVLGVLLPVAVLIAWSMQGVASAQVQRVLGRAVLSSLTVAGLAAVVTVAAGLPLAILSVRFPGMLSSFLERSTYVGFSLPRIAIALGLVFFGAGLARPVYQTVVLLLFAYAILFLPTALGSLAAALRQVHPRLEEAARGLGRQPPAVFLRVTLPIMWPGVLSGAALVFLLTMEELPATLILRPGGLDTLATLVWSSASEALFAEAAVPALLLTVVSGLSIALLLGREAPT
jgi:iron(III) transport system permease protein